jgi:Ca2+-binding EF-hand superfamily protein
MVASMAEEQELPSSVFVVEILVVILLSLAFETGQDKLRDYLKEHDKEDMISLVDTVFKEITVLGFIGLFVYVMTHTGALTDLAIAVYGEAAAGDAISESFEKVHMIIFSVMMVFIFQALVMMHMANQQSEKWEKWERAQARGIDGDTVESQLVAEGFLNADREKAEKPVTQTTNPLTRLLQAGGVRELIQWRAIRHVFLWPHEEHDGIRETTIKPKQPSSFHIADYFTKRVYDIFEDIIEVDQITWIIALCCSPSLTYFLALSPMDRIVAQAFFGWALFFIMFGFGVIVYDVYIKVTPLLPDDPDEILKMLKGTSSGAFATANRQKKAVEAEADDRAATTRFGFVAAEGEKTTPLLRPEKQLVARFRKEPKEGDYNPWHARWGISKALPNAHERLFPFADAGVSFLTHAFEVCMLFQAVATAGLFVTLIVVEYDDWTHYGACFWVFAACAPAMQWKWLVPKVITKFAIVSSVEMMKDAELMHEVTSEVKKKQVRETLKLTRILRLQGKAERMRGTEHNIQGASLISPEKFAENLEEYKKFPKKKQAEMENFFKHFDRDGSGDIDADEMKQVLQSLGDFGDEIDDLVKTLMSLVDRDGDGQLGLPEFRVLMALALKKPSPEEEKDEMECFFNQFDDDRSGFVDIPEMKKKFDELGCNLDEEELRDIVYETFKKPKEKLTCEEFTFWVKMTEDQMRGEASG